MSLEVFEVVLVQCNLVDNQCQQKFKVLYIFMSNKLLSYAYLLNNLVLLKTCNTEFDEIITSFTDQNGRLIEIENKELICLCLLINRNDALFYRTKNKKYVERYGFFSFARIYMANCQKKLQDTAIKTGGDAAKTDTKEQFIKELKQWKN